MNMFPSFSKCGNSSHILQDETSAQTVEDESALHPSNRGGQPRTAWRTDLSSAQRQHVGKRHKLQQGKLQWDTRKQMFTGKEVKHWNKLPRETVEHLSLEILRLVWIRYLMQIPLRWAGIWTRWMAFWVNFLPKLLYAFLWVYRATLQVGGKRKALLPHLQ